MLNYSQEVANRESCSGATRHVISRCQPTQRMRHCPTHDHDQWRRMGIYNKPDILTLSRYPIALIGHDGTVIAGIVLSRVMSHLTVTRTPRQPPPTWTS